MKFTKPIMTIESAIEGYHNIILKCRDDGPRGGVGMFIKSTLNYKIREDISVFVPHICDTL